ncbi:MAG: methylase [Proteobacteria bacterium]|nr:methylase [Pseudomonadota bacterium]
MSKFYEILQFNNIHEASKREKELGIDKIHYSGKYPTVFFKEVLQFDEETIREIAKTHHNLWNFKKVTFLYVTALTEIRIYNCNSKPVAFNNDSKDIQGILKNHEIVASGFDDKEKLSQLVEIFSAHAVDSGSIWTRNNEYLKKIKLDKRIDKFLVASLVNLAKVFKQDGISLDIIHALIMRSLFIMYLEDKKATPEEFYKGKNKEVNSYFDLLEDEEATYAFFGRIKENFNGNVFPVTELERETIKGKHLQLLKKCFINGEIKNENLFSDWRIFKFDIINIELLSQIYENFLSEIDKELSGSYYTPPELVELMLNEVLPIDSQDYKVKILDPTCGSGIFLVEAYKRIVKRWQKAHPNKGVDFKILKELMHYSIYGIELNKNSIKVTTFSLYLAMLDFLHPATLWYQGEEKFPYLINDKDDNTLLKQGYNLYRTDTIIDNKEIEKDYDVIVGNPPYGENAPIHIKQYCQDRNFPPEFVIPFIYKSTLLAPNGKIALLAPTKLLTKTQQPSQNFRKWLFNENYVEKIYNLSILRKAPKAFGGQLFSSAVVPASIYFFQSKIPTNPSKTIEYWSPKTYIKNHLAEGIIIDSSDIKYLPRFECQKPNTKIWKIAQWGNLNDFNLLNRLLNKSISFMDFAKKNNIKHGVGFQLLSNRKRIVKEDQDLCKLPYLKASTINRLYTVNSNYPINDSLKEATLPTQKVYLEIYQATTLRDIPQITKFNMTAKYPEIFKAPHFVLKKGFISGNQICGSYIDYDCSFRDGVYGFYSETKNEIILKYLSVVFSSNYAHYFLLMTASSYTVEREQIMLDEYLELPLPNIDNDKIHEIANTIDRIIGESHHKVNENEINNTIYDILDFSQNERILIDDAIKYKVDLFHKGDKSISMKPLNSKSPESIEYSKKLCYELNQTLKDSELEIISTVYQISHFSPLALVVLQFVDKVGKEIDKHIITYAEKEFNHILSMLNRYTLREYSKGIYVQKNLTYFDDDKIYVVKPNQKRFWNLSSAIEDAQNITLEIMSMY